MKRCQLQTWFLLIFLLQVRKSLTSNQSLNMSISEFGFGQDRHTITILGGFSLSGGWIGGGSVGAAILGLQHINYNSSLLPNYYLNMTWSDTKVNSTNMLIFCILKSPISSFYLFLMDIIILAMPSSDLYTSTVSSTV